MAIGRETRGPGPSARADGCSRLGAAAGRAVSKYLARTRKVRP